jgi:hypothetical protein
VQGGSEVKMYLLLILLAVEYYGEDDNDDVDDEKMLKCSMMVNEHTWILGFTANQIREE